MFAACVAAAIATAVLQSRHPRCDNHKHLLAQQYMQVRKTLRDSVKDIIHQVGVTSILVTHDQEEAFDIADKVVIFNRLDSMLSFVSLIS